ncbi:MAG: DUF5686 and carboxypeptidase regulatory-like domain-containing protein [Bacteroidota bacterium]
MRRKGLWGIGLWLMYACLFGQITGTVSDETGAPLPYVSIYLKGTTTGTTTNLDGNYELRIAPGQYTIAYQYVGYTLVEKDIEIGDQPLRMDVQLTPQATLLNEIVIAADAEDPAYRVIREAIKKRTYYRDLIDTYTCKVYVKGNTKLTDAPEKIFGQDVGDLEGALDSNRQGIIYLSESISDLYVQRSDVKEVITSSKISGDDGGYSWNSARDMGFSFYENNIDLQRQMVSPIANNALSYYRYELVGTYYDNENRLINKIKVIPKRKSDPTFFGTVYIVEDLWNLQSTDLAATGQSLQVYLIDTLHFRQVNVPLKEPDVWGSFNNTIEFSAGMFGFDVKGVFSAVYSDYDLEPTIPDGFFNRVVLEVLDDSNERDTAFWNEIRPIPLTSEESVDYIKKDSIQLARKDPIYMDSMDRVDNKFGLGDVLSSYSYRKRSKQLYAQLSSPLNHISFNSVQGWNSAVEFNFQRYANDRETHGVYGGAKVEYGFSEQRARADGFLRIDPSGKTWNYWDIRGGSRIRQFDPDAIELSSNMFYSLFLKDNFALFYDETFVQVAHLFEPTPGIFMRGEVSYSDRSPLSNTTNYSFFKRDEDYESNDPLFPNNDGPSFEDHQALTIQADLIFLLGLKFAVRPDIRYGVENNGPRIALSYTGSYNWLGGDLSYHKLAGTISDTWEIGVGGELDWYLNGGTFFDVDRIEFMDVRHFNTVQTGVSTITDYSQRFLLLPFYEFSTADTYVQAHLQHNFNGWILDKVPLFNELGWNLVAGAKYLKSGDLSDYAEFHVGVDNVGFSFIRLLRVDVATSFYEGQQSWGVRVGIGID